jgi:hypothetical protein
MVKIMYYTTESFIKWCDEMHIANEAVTDNKESNNYKSGVQFKNITIKINSSDLNDEIYKKFKPYVKKSIVALNKVFDKEYNRLFDIFSDDHNSEYGNWAPTDGKPMTDSELKKLMKISDCDMSFRDNINEIIINLWMNTSHSKRFYNGHSVMMTFEYNIKTDTINYYGHNLFG